VKQSQDAVNQTQQIQNADRQAGHRGSTAFIPGYLSLAVDKMKEATDATKQAEQVADNTIRAVQKCFAGRDCRKRRSGNFHLNFSGDDNFGHRNFGSFHNR